MLRFIRQVFFKGLIAVLPVALTVYLVLWLARGFETLLGGLIQFAIPSAPYVPGMGLLAGVALVFGVGLMLQTWFTRKLWDSTESILDKMPLVRAVFGASRQVVSWLDTSEGPSQGRAVQVKLGDERTRLLGLVTREDLDFLGRVDGNGQENIAVFLPWSYQVGGFTVFVPASSVERIHISANEALGIALTGAVGEPDT